MCPSRTIHKAIYICVNKDYLRGDICSWPLRHSWCCKHPCPTNLFTKQYTLVLPIFLGPCRIAVRTRPQCDRGFTYKDYSHRDLYSCPTNTINEAIYTLPSQHETHTCCSKFRHDGKYAFSLQRNIRSFSSQFRNEVVYWIHVCITKSRPGADTHFL